MMRRLPWPGVVLLALSASPGGAQALRFEKVSDHCHVLQLPGEERNVCAIASSKGVMLVNPPPPADLARVRDALKAVSAAPVLWLLHTDPLYAREDTAQGLAGKGTVILSSEEQYKLAGTPGDPAATTPAPEKKEDPRKGEPGAPLTFTFGRQVTLYPDGVEVRVIAVPHRGRTGGDIVVLIPSEKLLLAGDLFRVSGFPEIVPGEAGGSALGWIDGFKQVIDAVPLLKSAMPQPKPDPAKPPPEEKTLEELVTVVPGRGPRSNLMEMKALLETVQKMRAEIGRAVSSRRSREAILSWASLAPYRSLAGFETFAGLLYDELAAARAK